MTHILAHASEEAIIEMQKIQTPEKLTPFSRKNLSNERWLLGGQPKTAVPGVWERIMTVNPASQKLFMECVGHWVKVNPKIAMSDQTWLDIADFACWAANGLGGVDCKLDDIESLDTERQEQVEICLEISRNIAEICAKCVRNIKKYVDMCGNMCKYVEVC